MTFQWLNQNPLYDLARQGKRLTPWWLLVPLAWAMIFVAGFFALPLVIALVSLYGFSLGGFMQDLNALPPTTAAFWQSLLLTFSSGGLILFVWLWARLYEKRPLATLGFIRRDALLQYGRGAGLGFLTFAGAVGLMALFGFLAPEASDPGRVGFAALGGVLLLLLPGWVVQGASEEILTRGWMLPVLSARYRPWVGLALSSLFFALAHGLNPNLSALALINLLLYGLFAALYALREGSLWGICAFHSFWNWAQGNLFGLQVSGLETGGTTLLNLVENGPDWFTGGAFGPEGGFAVTVMLLLGMALMFLYRPAEKRLLQSSEAAPESEER